MNSLAPSLDLLKPTLDTGVILARAPGGWRVRAGRRDATCRTALSCLVEPRPGDRVLLALEGSGALFALAVLDRPEGPPGLELRLEGPVDLHVRGDLALRGDGDLALASGGRLSGRADHLELDARSGAARMDRFAFLGRFLETQVERWHLFAIRAEQVFRRVTSTARESCRFVERHDEVQAGSRRVLVKEELTLQSGSSHLLARDRVTVTAEQIHLN